MSEKIDLFKANAILVHRYPREAEEVDMLLRDVGISCGISVNSTLVALLMGRGGREAVTFVYEELPQEPGQPGKYGWNLAQATEFLKHGTMAPLLY